VSDVQIYPGLVHLNGCLMAAVDLETTGTQAGYHEIIQIAVVPLDSDIRPLAGVQPFYTLVKPKHPERESEAARHKHKIPMEELLLHAPESEQVADWLCEWFERLKLPFKKCLIPLAHNWAFESSFLKAWLGVDMTDQIFHSHARDGMLYAVALNDRAAFKGEPALFNRVSLSTLCAKLNIVNTNPHDALADCIAEAEVYRTLLRMP
jgi:DNA polymerase III epsilon subunit-like protein